MPSLSVVIPTYRRPQILKLCMQCLEHQTIADDLEVIVVSDGPDPATAALFKEPTPPALRSITYLEIPKSHQGTARNYGVKHAHAPFVLFIGDDILLNPDACEKHLAAHRTVSGEAAVLGFTTWDPVCDITPVMRFLEKSGWQFGYPSIAKYAHHFLPSTIQQRYTYTSHVSLPTELARQFKFREDVSLYGWEDIEWGDRLKKAGVRLFYEPEATALHHHHITLEQSLMRMETLGESLAHMAKIAPGFKEKMAWWRIAYQRLRSFAPTMNGQHRRALLRGMKRAIR